MMWLITGGIWVLSKLCFATPTGGRFRLGLSLPLRVMRGTALFLATWGVLFRILVKTPRVATPRNWFHINLQFGKSLTCETPEIYKVATKVTRAEKLLERLTLNDQITSSGRDFLLAALDPMHDNQLHDLSGWPDVETASSVVRCIKQSVTVSKPGTLGPGNWDAYVVQWPWLTTVPFMSTSNGQRLNNYLNVGVSASPLAGGFLVGGLAVYAVNQGGTPNYARNPDYVLVSRDSFNIGAQRLIGLGIEAVNTTAEIYRQGQVCVWRDPNGSLDPETVQISGSWTAGGAYSTFATGQKYASPPKAFSEAMLIPGTRQWRADDGFYIVAPLIGQDNPPLMVDSTVPIVHTTSTADVASSWTIAGPNTYNNSVLMCPRVEAPTTLSYVLPSFRQYPIHMVGSIFTGLSEQTTFTLSQNVFLETFPTPAEPDILVLATPSAEYDPVALQLYSHSLMTLPVGVPAYENGLGDWFADLVQTITNYLTPGALALGQPGLAAISQGANALASGYLRGKNPEERKVAMIRSPSTNTKKARSQAVKNMTAGGRPRKRKQKSSYATQPSPQSNPAKKK